MTFAEAPMSVPFPPKHAPKDSDHQRGSNSVGDIPPKVPIWCIKGIIVAAKGMLSTKAEAIAENHNISIPVSVKLPSVAVNAHFAMLSIRPVSIRPPTTMNNPIKKKMVGHSTANKISSGSSLVMNIKRTAPDKAIVADSKCCLLYTSDAADEEDSVDLGGRRIIKKKKKKKKNKK